MMRLRNTLLFASFGHLISDIQTSQIVYTYRIFSNRKCASINVVYIVKVFPIHGFNYIMDYFLYTDVKNSVLNSEIFENLK